jgi:hypothetical protein
MSKFNIPGEHKKFDPIPKIDLDKIEKHGKTDGNLATGIEEDNLPATLLKEKNKLLHYKHEQYLKAQGYFHDMQTHINNYYDDFNSDSISINLHKQIDQEVNFDQEETFLSKIYDNFNLKKENYLNFRKLNGISYLPKNSDPIENRKKFYFLIILFIFEFLLNLGMLHAGGSTELSAAFTISIAQSVVNVLSCYLAGKMLLGHIQFGTNNVKKISLSILGILHAYIILILNVNMGIFRQAIDDQPTGADALLNAKALFSEFRFNPWDQISHDFNTISIFVIGVGIIFAVLAYLDGYISDDPYPGYGDVYRAALTEKRSIENRIHYIHDRWHSSKKSASSHLEKFKDKGLSSITAWSNAINNIEQIWEDYKSILVELDKKFKTICDIYIGSYNKFHSDKKNHKLAKITLLEKDDYNLSVIFRDVSNFYMDDQTRGKKTKIMKESFINQINKISSNLTSQGKQNDLRLQKFSQSFKCQL